MDLSPTSGLPMHLETSGKLIFSPDIVIEEYRARLLNELTAVYLDQQACRGEQVAYEMFNGVFDRKDQERVGHLEVRYELTLFPGLKIGREYVKTLGHIHQPEARSGIDHPEICEVLVGRAHFLFMKINPDKVSADEVFYVEVCAGEKIIIPPGYDHLTINPGPGPLLFADVVGREVAVNYERIKAARGAVYLEVDDQGTAKFIPNPQYRSHPPLRKGLVREQRDIHLSADVPLYTAFVETRAKDWEFLWRPELFHSRFPTLDSIFHL